MKVFSILIATFVTMAAAHGQIEDPGVNGRREQLGRAIILSARQGDGAGPYEGPSDPGANGRKRQADSAGPYEGPINPPGGGEKKRQNEDGAGPFVGPELPGGGSKKRQENQTPLGAFGGTVPSGGGSRIKGRQAGELPDPVVAARQSESTGTEG